MKYLEYLQAEYSKADLSNIETLKQIVINEFKKNGFTFSKIRTGKNKDGIFIYHEYGDKFYQNKKEIIEETDTKRIYRRYKKEYRVSFIDTTDFEYFADMLEMVISEIKCKIEWGKNDCKIIE